MQGRDGFQIILPQRGDCADTTIDNASAVCFEGGSSGHRGGRGRCQARVFSQVNFRSVVSGGIALNKKKATIFTCCCIVLFVDANKTAIIHSYASTRVPQVFPAQVELSCVACALFRRGVFSDVHNDRQRKHLAVSSTWLRVLLFTTFNVI